MVVTDKTIDIIKKRKQIDYWISSDKGIYDAFNGCRS